MSRARQSVAIAAVLLVAVPLASWSLRGESGEVVTAFLESDASLRSRPGAGGTQAAPSLPPGFLSTSLECDAAAALVLGGLRRSSRPWVSGEAVAFRVVAGSAELERISLGEGSVVDSSRPEPGSAAAAVVASWTEGRLRTGRLMRSEDAAAPWREIAGSPAGLIGVELLSEKVGYVWSEPEVYKTTDGGISWTGVEWPRPLSRPFPRPAVDESGALWALVGGSSGRGDVFVRFSGAGPVERIAAPDDRTIEALAFVGDVPIVVARREGSNLVELQLLERDSDPRALVSFDADRAEHLQVEGQRLLVGFWQLQGAERVDRAIKSEDAGATWSEVRLPETRVRQYCMTRSGSIWLVGSSNQVYRLDEQGLPPEP